MGEDSVFAHQHFHLVASPDLAERRADAQSADSLEPLVKHHDTPNPMFGRREEFCCQRSATCKQISKSDFQGRTRRAFKFKVNVSCALSSEQRDHFICRHPDSEWSDASASKREVCLLLSEAGIVAGKNNRQRQREKQRSATVPKPRMRQGAERCVIAATNRLRLR